MNLREKIRAFVTIEVEEGKKVKKLPITALSALSAYPIDSVAGLSDDAKEKLLEEIESIGGLSEDDAKKFLEEVQLIEGLNEDAAKKFLEEAQSNEGLSKDNKLYKKRKKEMEALETKKLQSVETKILQSIEGLSEDAAKELLKKTKMGCIVSEKLLEEIESIGDLSEDAAKKLLKEVQLKEAQSIGGYSKFHDMKLLEEIESIGGLSEYDAKKLLVEVQLLEGLNKDAAKKFLEVAQSKKGLSEDNVNKLYKKRKKEMEALETKKLQSIEGLNKDAAIKLFEKRKKEMETLESEIDNLTLDYDKDRDKDRLGIRDKILGRKHKKDAKESEEAEELKKVEKRNKDEKRDKDEWEANIEKKGIKKTAEDSKKLDNSKRLGYGQEYYIKRLNESTIYRLFDKNKPFCPSEDNIKLLKKVIGNGLFTEFDEEVEASIEKSICTSKTCEVMDCLRPASTIYLSQYRHKSLGPFRTEPDTRHEAKIDLCGSCFKQYKGSVLKEDYATLFKQALEEYYSDWLSQYLGIDLSKISRIKDGSDEFKVIDKSTSIKIHRLLVGASKEAMFLHLNKAFKASLDDSSCTKYLIEEVFPMRHNYEFDEDDNILEIFISFPEMDWRDDHLDWLHAYVEEELGPKLITESESVEQELNYHLGNYMVSPTIDYPLEFEYAYERINKDGEGSITVAVNLTASFGFATEDEEPPSISVSDFFEYFEVNCVLERTIDFKNPKEFKLRVLNKTTY
jgi:hypothetical protein